MKDTRLLEKVIRDSVVSGMPGLEGDIQKARNILDILGGGRGGKTKQNHSIIYCYLPLQNTL